LRKKSKSCHRIISFLLLEIHKVHSANQKYYILNVVDLLKEYDDKAVEIIAKKATQKIGFSIRGKYVFFISD